MHGPEADTFHLYLLTHSGAVAYLREAIASILPVVETLAILIV
jgi:hypothetical protein